jgi:hypothetical protein
MPILEATAVIRARDETAAAFSSVEARIKEIARTVSSVGLASGSTGRAVRDTQAMTREVSGATRATDALATSMNRVHSSVSRAHKEVGAMRASLRETAAAVGPVIGLGAMFAGYEGIKHVVNVGFAREHERVRMVTSGMKPGEVQDAEIAAAQLGAKYGPISNTDIMHMLRNTRSIVGSYAEAKDIIDPLLALRVVATGAHPGQDMEEDFDKLVKGLEIKGVTQDPAKFKAYMNAMGKDVLAFGDTLKPSDFYEAFKLGRQATQSLSLDYMTSVAPKLIQELGGPGAGVAQQAFYTAVVGGHMTKTALQKLEEFALVDKSKVVAPKGGHLASAAGAIQDWQLAAVNPYEWVNKILLPAMAKKGIIDPLQIQEVVSSMFSKSTAAQLVGILATQQSAIEKDRQVIHSTMSTDDAAKAFMKDDPIIAAKSLGNALDNMASELGFGSKEIAHGLSGLADIINEWVANANEKLRRIQTPDLPPRREAWAGLDLGDDVGARMTDLRNVVNLLNPATAPATLAQLQARQATIYEDMDKGAGDWLAQHYELEEIRAKIKILQGGPGAFAAAREELAMLDQVAANNALLSRARYTRERAGQWPRDAEMGTIAARNREAFGLFPSPFSASYRGGSFNPGPLPGGDSIAQMIATKERLDEITRETSRGNALSNLPRDLKVSLDPASRADIAVHITVEDGNVVTALATATAKASGNLAASVGTSTAGVSPNGPGGIGRR